MASCQKKVEKLEYEFVEELPEELTCSICANVLCQPHLMNCCEQQFCEACLEQWLKKSPVCPHCRSTNHSHMLLQQLARKIGEMKVYCPNKMQGCQSTVKIRELDSHLSTANEEGCLYVKLKCPLQCTFQAFRKSMADHLGRQCPKRKVFCTRCNKSGEHHFIVGDHVGSCPLYPQKCPQGCGDTVLKKNLDIHKNTCSLEVIPCSYSELGCKVRVCRKDLEEHLKLGIHQHMVELARSFQSLQADHANLKERYSALKADYNSLKADHSQVKANHDQLQASYRKLQTKHREERNTLKRKCTSLQNTLKLYSL